MTVDISAYIQRARDLGTKIQVGVACPKCYKPVASLTEDHPDYCCCSDREEKMEGVIGLEYILNTLGLGALNQTSRIEGTVTKEDWIVG